MKKKTNSMLPYVFLLIFIIGCMVFVNLNSKEIHEIKASEFMKNLNEQKISALKIVTKVRSSNYQVTGKLSDYKENESFVLYLPVSEEFMKKIVAAEETQNFK